jgi:hypothetical protein
MQNRPPKVIAAGIARSFVSSNNIKDMRVNLYSPDAKADTADSSILTTTTQSNGEFKLASASSNDLILEFQHWFYHPTVKGGTQIPTDGINDPDPLKNLTIQIPDWISIYLFAFLLGATTTREGYFQGVCSNVTEANTTLRDFPHGLNGVKVELLFHDPKLQSAWKLEQSHDIDYRKMNNFLDKLTTLHSVGITLLAYYSFHKTEASLKTKLTHILAAIAIGLADKTIHALIAWRYYKDTITTFYLAAWKRGYLKGYTDPTNDRLTLTSKDGGVLFNLKNLKLPESGAKFTLVATKKGYRFEPISGYALPNKFVVFTHPQALTAAPTENDKPKIKAHDLEEKGRPIRLLKSLTLGSSVAIASYLKGQSVLRALTSGAITATVALFCLEGLYKKTINPRTIFGSSLQNNPDYGIKEIPNSLKMG